MFDGGAVQKILCLLQLYGFQHLVGWLAGWLVGWLFRWLDL